MLIRHLFACVIFLLSCLVSKSQDSTFIREIPVEHYASGRPEVFETIFALRDSLQLDTLENGYDSLQIRFWLANRSMKQQVIILKYRNGRSLAYSAIFTPHLSENRDSIRYIDRAIGQIRPKVGWSTIWDSLFNLRVMSLPHFEKIKGYPIPHDAASLTIEVATPHLYRQYGYYSPYSAAEKIPEAAKVIRMLQLIERYFGIKLIDGFIKR